MSDKPPFDEVFLSLRERVLALCLHLTGNRADAEDALQETFLGVYRGLPAFRGESEVSTWVYRIAIRTALRVKARSRAAGCAGPLDADVVDPHPGRAGPRTGPDALVAREDMERLAAALASLPFEHRVVLSLFAIDGLRHKEIAAILGIPEGTVWSRLHVARKRLATMVDRSPGTLPR